MMYGTLLLAGCNTENAHHNDHAATKERAAAHPQQQGIEVGGTAMVDTKSIAGNMLNSNDHTTFTKAATAAGIIETLSGPGPFTVFAPTNEAFNKLPAGTVDDLLLPGRKQDLVNILNYHIIQGTFKTADLQDGMELKTVQGKTLKISRQNGKWHINNATVTIPDVLSANGITFIVDAVLLPGK